jgi:hypothetical protein
MSETENEKKGKEIFSFRISPTKKQWIEEFCIVMDIKKSEVMDTMIDFFILAMKQENTE